MKRIAICFFGITRSLYYTHQSIEQNVLQPARDVGAVDIFGHFFLQERVNNPRSNEFGALRQNEHELIDWKDLLLEEPDTCLSARGFQQIARFGDFWNDDLRSLRNLIHQLHSLERVSQLALSSMYDVILFLRPDLMYHDSFSDMLAQAARFGHRSKIFLPGWQSHRGLNDRFCIATGHHAAKAYASRIDYALRCCEELNAPLHSERLLSFALSQNGIAIKKIKLRASRVRSNGEIKAEDFTIPHRFRVVRGLQRRINRIRKTWLI